MDKLICCDPYRNALIAREGDKDDSIDWRKLAGLPRSGQPKAACAAHVKFICNTND